MILLLKMSLSKVDFPAPDGPINNANSPRSMLNDTPSSATCARMCAMKILRTSMSSRMDTVPHHGRSTRRIGDSRNWIPRAMGVPKRLCEVLSVAGRTARPSMDAHRQDLAPGEHLYAALRLRAAVATYCLHVNRHRLTNSRGGVSTAVRTLRAARGATAAHALEARAIADEREGAT